LILKTKTFVLLVLGYRAFIARSLNGASPARTVNAEPSFLSAASTRAAPMMAAAAVAVVVAVAANMTEPLSSLLWFKSKAVVKGMRQFTSNGGGASGGM
jgi:hypothetical protein